MMNRYEETDFFEDSYLRFQQFLHRPQAPKETRREMMHQVFVARMQRNLWPLKTLLSAKRCMAGNGLTFDIYITIYMLIHRVWYCKLRLYDANASCNCNRTYIMKLEPNYVRPSRMSRSWLRFLPLLLAALAALASGWSLRSSVAVLSNPQRLLCHLAYPASLLSFKLYSLLSLIRTKYKTYQNMLS